jgi:filamentous hemagglutinin
MSESARRSAEMRAATRQLREDIENGKVDASMFTDKQLEQIKSGSKTIKGYTWHHNSQSSPNNMQLVPSEIHNVKDGGIPHSGEGSMNR